MAIPISQLRVGNWIIFDLGGGVEKAGTINPNDFSEPLIFDVGRPIPLTPEVLINAGFIKDDYWWGDGINYYGNKVLDVRFGNEEIADIFDVVFYGQQEMPVKYLHQLQNLYFALTGEELTVNL